VSGGSSRGAAAASAKSRAEFCAHATPARERAHLKATSLPSGTCSVPCDLGAGQLVGYQAPAPPHLPWPVAGARTGPCPKVHGHWGVPAWKARTEIEKNSVHGQSKMLSA
jgi:hypothetical protein